MARTPHGYHDFELIQDELIMAGFSNISIDTLEETSTAPSPRHPAIAYCQGTTLRNEIESRDASLLNMSLIKRRPPSQHASATVRFPE